MNEKFDISEAYSMNYLIHSIFIIGFGLAMIYFNWFVAIFILLFGIALMFIKTGVQFSTDLKKVKSYQSIFELKLGISRVISDFKKVDLKYTDEASFMFSQGLGRVIRVRTFDIVMTNFAHQKIILHEFTDYKLAEKTFNVFQKQLKLNGINHISEIQKAIVKRRRSSRRR
jgi:hypothetical protein